MTGRARRRPGETRGLAGPRARKTVSLALQGGGFNRRVPGARTPAVEELAVVGGTGAYASAHGIVEVRPSKDGNARLIVRVKG